MYSKNNNIDMLHGQLTKNLLLFTIPVALSSMLQQLFTAADTSVLGFFGDADALAATGTNTEIVALIVSLSAGLAIGANLLIASKIGQNDTAKIPQIVQTTILLAIIIGSICCILGQLICKPLLLLLQTPVTILSEATLYLRIYLLGYPFLLVYDFASAIFRAYGDSRYPFVALSFSGIANVCLNLLFVAVFHTGITGVAVATTISTALSAILLLRRLGKNMQLSIYDLQFFKATALAILRVGVPAAMQGAVFCFANIFVQAAINTFGVAAIAGSTIAMHFEYFTYYIIAAFGQAATTFTAQNYAAGRHTRCRHILSVSLILSTICSSALIFCIVFSRGFFTGLFTSDAAVIDNAVLRILCILSFEPLCNLYEIPAGCLRGRGYSLYPAVATMIGTCIFRVLWVFTVFQKTPTLSMLYYTFPLSWIVTILLVNAGFVFVLLSSRLHFAAKKNELRR